MNENNIDPYSDNGQKNLDRNVLLVTDDTQTMMKLTNIIQTNHRVHSSSSALKARSMIRSCDIDVLIADHRMQSSFDGYELCRHVATHHPDVTRLLIPKPAFNPSLAIETGIIDGTITEPFKPIEIFRYFV
jgi:PleD family two-component response regulator